MCVAICVLVSLHSGAMGRYVIVIGDCVIYWSYSIDLSLGQFFNCMYRQPDADNTNIQCGLAFRQFTRKQANIPRNLIP